MQPKMQVQPVQVAGSMSQVDHGGLLFQRRSESKKNGYRDDHIF